MWTFTDFTPLIIILGCFAVHQLAVAWKEGRLWTRW